MKPKYLSTYTERRCNQSLSQSANWHSNIGEAIITIPAYKENWDTLKSSLDSLAIGCLPHIVDVLILINYKSEDSQEIKDASLNLYKHIEAYIQDDKSSLRFNLFIKELTGKKAGVGMARKLLMDCAFLRFRNENKDGIIICLDADTRVRKGYLSKVLAAFAADNSFEAGSIDFAHPIEIVDGEEKNAILYYELHLRYFIGMQRFIMLPYAFQTIGSAMAVKAYAYAKQGGMPVRQAGEDFYFLHKYSKDWKLTDISTTTVIPSPRTSNRVPFGTGRAVLEYLSGGEMRGTSYNPESFILLGDLLRELEYLVYYNISIYDHKIKSNTLKSFFEENNYKEMIHTICSTTSDNLGRIKKFYAWFDAFKLMKYLHYMRDAGYSNLSISECINYFMQAKNIPHLDTKQKQLGYLRNEYQNGDYNNQWRAGLISRLSKTSAS